MVKSIFELEKRTDIRKECLRIEKYLAKPQLLNFDGYLLTIHFDVWLIVVSNYGLIDIRTKTLQISLIY